MGLCIQCDDFRGMRVPSFSTQCDRCDNRISASEYPFFVISGVSGVGKSTLVPELIAQLPDHMIMDADELYGLGNNFGWDVHRNTLLRFAATVGKNGRPSVLCGTIYRDELDEMPARTAVGTIHYLNLDCSDSVREERLRPRLTRLSWSEDDIQEFFAKHRLMAAQFRNEFETTIDVTEMTIGATAAMIINWIKKKSPNKAMEATS